MKKWILFTVLAFSFFACEEIPPELNPITGPTEPSDTTFENQKRQVLIEEFTGVQCVNCPAGSEAIETLLNIHGDQLMAISIHAGFFSPPYSDSQFDFRTSAGNNLLSYLGEPFGFPTAVVNRKKFDGEFNLQLGQGKWAGFIAQEIAEEPRLKLKVEQEYNPISGLLRATVTMVPQETIIEDDIRLSVFITENNVVDAQLTPAGKRSDYVHKHVLRDAMTNFDGNPIDEALTANVELIQPLEYTLDPNWVSTNISLIALVHLNGERKDVLQAAETKIVE